MSKNLQNNLAEVRWNKKIFQYFEVTEDFIKQWIEKICDRKKTYVKELFYFLFFLCFFVCVLSVFAFSDKWNDFFANTLL